MPGRAIIWAGVRYVGMKRLFLSVAFLLFGLPFLGQAQRLHCADSLLCQAFDLALWTIDHNTHEGVVHAGGGYGGEWTRDCAINCWNAMSLLRPEVATRSLWSVTEDSVRIGHQYWDKILWAIAAHNHFLVTGDTAFLRKAYLCSRTTMEELEGFCFDSLYGLFAGPAVFQDGIAGYDEPVYDPAKWDDSYVLHHPHSDRIKCLSTNAVYCQAYRCLAEMGACLGAKGDKAYAEDCMRKAEGLQDAILRHLYNADTHRPYYLIDHLGHKHEYQEGLGHAFLLLFDILPAGEARQLPGQTYISAHGIPCVYPSFPRNTPDKPGRHNMMIWPHVNMLYASGCAHRGLWEPFYFELNSLADLAIRRGEGDFYEIYTLDGEPSGGWQCGGLWDKKEHQTWCATGFLRLVTAHIFGLTFAPEGLLVLPHGMEDGSAASLEGIRYRNAILDISVKGRGDHVQSCIVNGKKMRRRCFIPTEAAGRYSISFIMSEK